MHRTPADPTLRVQIEPSDRSATIRLIGELDIATVDRFEARSDELMAEGFDHLVLDLRELTFMDSSGLRAIVKLHCIARGSVRLQIVDGPDHVQRVFTVTGLRRVLPFAAATDAPAEPASDQGG